MQSHTARGLEEFAVERGEDAHNVVGACTLDSYGQGHLTSSGSDDAATLIDRLKELADDKRNGLDALHLLLGTEKLLPQVLGLVANVVL